jgi:acetyl esterase
MAIDEATAGLLAQLAESGARPLHELTPAEARGFGANLREAIGPGPDVQRSWDVTLETPDGGQFSVRVLVPDLPVRALVVYYHGGGWVIGNVEESDHLTRRLANDLQVAVVNVDYRLAPEHRFPAAADDAFQALQWASEQVAEIAGGHVPVIVMGDSAGGNLSAVVARKARDHGGPGLAAQVLIYPVTDADLDGASYTDPASQLLLTRDAMIWFWDHYAPDPAARLGPDAAPIRVADLAGLPPAIVLTAEHDPLRDEGEAYAARLRRAGVRVSARRFRGQMHGFFTLVGLLPGSEDAQRYVKEQLDHLLGPAAGG